MCDNMESRSALKSTAGPPAIRSRAVRRELASTFNEDAELYDRSRPRYTTSLFDDLSVLAGLSPDSRVLEIGCATGQATVPIAKLGCSLVAVELGASLAEVARRNISEYPKARVVVSAFEDWLLPTEPFDLVVAATSFHFIDENIRMDKTADALCDGGALAVIATYHVRGGTQDFFDESQHIYERLKLSPPGYHGAPSSTDIPENSAEFDMSMRFGPVTFSRHEWEVTYTTQEYLDSMSTYSSNRSLSEEARGDLYSSIANLLNTKYDGKVTKRYMAQIAFARKRASI